MAPSRIQVQGFPVPPCNLFNVSNHFNSPFPDLRVPNADFGLKNEKWGKGWVGQL